MTARPEDFDALMRRVSERHAAVEVLIRAAQDVCQKLEHPTASVTIDDQISLRSAIDAVTGAPVKDQPDRGVTFRPESSRFIESAERLTRALSDPAWKPARSHVEGARNDLMSA